MYKKEEVINIRNSEYELTPIDEKIYNEIGYVLHQADRPFGEHAHVVYKEHFGTILNQKLIMVYVNGDTYAEEWYLDRYGEKDCRELKLTEKEKELLKEKHKEMLEGFWGSITTVVKPST